MTPSMLDSLHAEYASIARSSVKNLTRDEARSLAHFHAEQQAGQVPGELTARVDRVGVWVRNLLSLEGFIEQHGRWPRENNRLPSSAFAPHEQHLANWVRTERRSETAQRRCRYQRLRLRCIRGYQPAPLDERWTARMFEYRAFTIVRHRAPAYRSADAAERSLAQWAAKQRLAHRTGRLPEGRSAALATLPIWTWG